jgi:hypothetical protein
VGLDVPGNLTRPAPGSSFEEHVLVDVRQTCLIRPFVSTASVDPGLEGGDARRVLLLKDNRQAVA